MAHDDLILEKISNLSNNTNNGFALLNNRIDHLVDSDKEFKDQIERVLDDHDKRISQQEKDISNFKTGVILINSFIAIVVILVVYIYNGDRRLSDDNDKQQAQQLQSVKDEIRAAKDQLLELKYDVHNK